MAAPLNDLRQRLEEVVESGDFVVPPYPSAAMRLRRLVESGKFGLAQVAEAASADSVLAISLLRIANSALYRAEGGPVTTLLRAVNRVGARSISSMALAAGVGGAACAPGPLLDVKYRIWCRSLTCALAAQRFAPSRGVDAEEAFLAGLLHGFGRSVALACVEKLLPKLPEKRTLSEWLELIEPQRAPLARRVAERWQLPDALKAAMGAEPGSSTPCASLVTLSDQLAAGLDRGAGARELIATPGLRSTELSSLESFLTSLPSTLAALVEGPEPNAKAPPASAVAKPQSSLTGELREFSLTILDLRKRKDPERLNARALTPTGLVLESPRPMQEGCVARLGVQLGTEPIEGWFNVVLCVPEGQAFRVEVQAFAPSTELLSTLKELWAKAPRLPA